MDYKLLFILILVAFVAIASTVDMVQATNQSENPATAERKHKPGDKFSHAKVCGLQLCR